MEDYNLKELLFKDINRFSNVDDSKSAWIKYAIKSSSFRTIFFYRLLKKQDLKGRKAFKKIILILSLLLNEIEIPYTAEIGGGLLLPHAKCIFIHQKAIIGDNVTILQGVTIGGNIFKNKNGRTSPIIGDNVLIGAGAKVLGPITVGENSMIGANAVVTKDVPKNSVAVGIPAKIIKKVDESYFVLEQQYNKK